MQSATRSEDAGVAERALRQGRATQLQEAEMSSLPTRDIGIGSSSYRGNIHSFETFGTHEGPGIRFVIFLQGCSGRCLYCQNPDTWEEGQGKIIGTEEIIARLDKCLPYIMSSKGGITVSGGEPLLQVDFLCALFRLCKDRKVHTAIDTSAFYRLPDEAKLPVLLEVTDLFIVDIKAVNKQLHKRITSKNQEQVMRFIALLENNKKQYWIRYVLVPGLNDSARDLKKLGKIISGLRYCTNFEFLPYHTLGKHKWGYLGLTYPLEGRRVAAIEDIKRAEAVCGIIKSEKREKISAKQCLKIYL